MKKLLYILYLLPLLSIGQMVPFGFFAEAVAACTADPNEKHISSNAASDPNCNEANATTGWLQFNTTNSVNSSDSNVGSHSISVLSDDGGTGFGYTNISATSGDDFDISFDAKQTVGSNSRFFITGLSVTNTGSFFPTSSWSTHSFSTTANATGTMQIAFYPAGDGGAGNTNDVVLIDNLSVIKTN